jgi:hypothetical protein
MKFTKEEAVSKIKAKFVGKTGNTAQMISDRSIAEQVDTLLNVGVVNDELELSDFVDKMAFPLCEVANNNLKKDNAEFVKNYKPEPPKPVEPPQPPQPTPPEDGQAKFMEMMKNFMAPVISEIQSIKQEKSLSARNTAIDQKVAALKLSKEWAVDFGNAREIAVLKLGENATADDIYNEAYRRFGETLSAKGQTYKPADSSGSSDGKDKTQTLGYLEKFKEEQKAVTEQSEKLQDYLGLSPKPQAQK